MLSTPAAIFKVSSGEAPTVANAALPTSVAKMTSYFPRINA